METQDRTFRTIFLSRIFQEAFTRFKEDEPGLHIVTLILNDGRRVPDTVIVHGQLALLSPDTFAEFSHADIFNFEIPKNHLKPTLWTPRNG